MTGSGSRQDDDAQASVTNVVYGNVSGIVIQAGSIHFHSSGSAEIGDAEPSNRNSDVEGHWGPRARGVMSNAETGHRFRGRETALREITAWLDRTEPDRRVLVVTGSPGAGKSAVLGRIVLTASADPAEHSAGEGSAGEGPGATPGSVACAVHAKGKTALDVAREIARVASAPIPNQPEDLPGALRKVLAGRRFNLIVDALDEATDPAQARLIATRVIRPIAENCADVGAQVVVGTRRFDGDGDLLRLFSPGSTVIDLDAPAYFALADLTAYARASLQLTGAERGENPYRDDAIAGPVAERIARLADKNFLIAGLAARMHGLFDQDAVPAQEIRLVADVEDALSGFLRRLPPVEDVSAMKLLTALAYVEAPGVSVDLWQVAVSALTGRTIHDDALWDFAKTSAANFLIATTDNTGREPVFRLFHQALNDALVHGAAPRGEVKLATAFVEHGRSIGWDRAPAYLLRSLPEHAARAGMVSDLLTDKHYLLHADLPRLLSATTRVDLGSAPMARDRLRLLDLAPTAVLHSTSPAERAAMLSITEAEEKLGHTYGGDDLGIPLPYRARWARTRPEPALRVMTTRNGGNFFLHALPDVNGRTLLASYGHDRTIRIWDPENGHLEQEITGHRGMTSTVCALPGVNGRTLLASNGDDDVIRIWDPETGHLEHELTGHEQQFISLCALPGIAGNPLLAGAGDRGAIRIWDPSTGRLRHELGKNVTTMCALPGMSGNTLLASTGDNRSIQIWDPETGHLEQEMVGPFPEYTSMCALPDTNGRTLLATRGRDRTIRIWDPTTGRVKQEIIEISLYARMCALPNINGRTLLAGHRDDGGRTIGVWDPETGVAVQTLESPIHLLDSSLYAVPGVNGRTLLASNSEFGVVQMWDPETGALTRKLTGQEGDTSMCVLPDISGRTLLASTNNLTIRIWDPETTGRSRQELASIAGRGAILCTLPSTTGRSLLATAMRENTIRVWDPETGELTHEIVDNTSGIDAVCRLPGSNGRSLLASYRHDQAIQIRDPETGRELRELSGITGVFFPNQLCALPDGTGNALLAVGSGNDRKITIWDVETGRLKRELHGAEFLNAMCPLPSADGRSRLATHLYNGEIQVWDPETGDLIQYLPGRSQYNYALCALPNVNGRTLLVNGSDSDPIQVWDSETGHLWYELAGHSDRVTALCAVYGAGGTTLLASGGHDRIIRLWDLRQAMAQVVMVIEVRSTPHALAWLDGCLFVVGEAGLTAIQLNLAVNGGGGS